MVSGQADSLTHLDYSSIENLKHFISNIGFTRTFGCIAGVGL